MTLSIEWRFPPTTALAAARHPAVARVHRDPPRMLGLRSAMWFQTFAQEDVAAAWLAVGRDSAVVSHESALALYDLSDIIPDAIHLTVPRSRRYLPSLHGVQLHTTTHPPGPSDVVERD